MKVDMRIIKAIVCMTSKEEVEVLNREFYLMPFDERKNKRDDIVENVNYLIARNKEGLRVINQIIKEGIIPNSIYDLFEDYIESVNAELTQIVDRL